MNEDYEVLLSKANALLLLAKASNVRCQGGAYLMRVLSNYCILGRDGSSQRLKLSNERISQKAYKIRKNLDLATVDGKKAFFRSTRNEHPEPLTQVWQWIIENKDKLDACSIIKRIYSYPMVTITIAEDTDMNKAGYRTRGSPEERFKAGGIVLYGDHQLKITPNVI